MSRARLSFSRIFSSRTGRSTDAYIIPRDMRTWTSPFRIPSVVGRLTRLPSFLNERRLHLGLRLHLHLHPRRQLHLRQLQDHLHHLGLHLQRLRGHLKLHLHLQVKKKSALRFPQASGYSSKRSSESRQICDHVSIVSRRASNSSFERNVSPVIIASRFTTVGSASLKT